MTSFYRLMPLVLLIGATPALFAQGSDERMISREATNYSLPPALCIQSAARIGDTVVVVWGTRSRTAGGTLVPRLMMQRVVTGTPVGEATPLTDTLARPAGMVKVIAADRSFVVVWNDLGVDRQGVYRKRIATDGVIDSDAVRLSDRPSLLGDPLIVGDRRIGQAMIWNDASGVCAVSFDADGREVSPAVLTPGTSVSIHHYAALGGGAVVRVDGAIGLLVRADGSIDERRAVPGLIFGPFILSSDTSIAVLNGQRVEFFSSPFATKADSSIPITLPDTVLPGTLALGRDSSGHFALYYLIRFGQPTVRMGQALYRVYLTGPDTGVPPQLVDSLSKWTNYYLTIPGTNTYTGLTGAVAATFGCDNLLTINSHQAVKYNTSRMGDRQESFDFAFTVDGSGRVDRSATAAATSCPTVEWVEPIVRSRSDLQSDVLVGAAKVRLSVAIDGEPMNQAQSQPGIFTDSGRLYVTWTLSSEKDLYVLSKVERDGTAIQPIDTLLVPLQELKGTIAGEFNTSVDDMLRFPNATIVRSRQSRHDYYLGNSGRYPVYAYALRLFHATPTGWREWRFDRMPSDLYAIRPFEGTMAVDPNGRRLFVTCRFGGYPDIHRLMVIDAMARGLASIDKPLLADDVLVPGNGSAYLSIQGTTQTYVSGTEITSLPSIDTLHWNATYARLLGDRFLRTIPMFLGKNSHRLEIYGLDGRRIVAGETIIGGSYAMVQNPLDSAIAFVYLGGDGRIRASLLGKNLEERWVDSVLTSNNTTALSVAATFLGDTLYVVWEARNGYGADIYMTRVRVPIDTVGVNDSIPATVGIPSYPADGTPTREPSVLESPTPAPTPLPLLSTRPLGYNVITAIAPNPAAHVARVELDLPTSAPADVSIHDFSGREVFRTRVAPAIDVRRSIWVDTRALVGGSYLVVLRCGASVDVKRLDVVHPK